MKNLFFISFLFSVSISVCYSQTQRSINEPMPSRQVHLDFHTSEFIPGIGEKFDKKQFQEALKIGHINQINIFSKCHHSWSCYPTKVGKMHPNLKFYLFQFTPIFEFLPKKVSSYPPKNAQRRNTHVLQGLRRGVKFCPLPSRRNETRKFGVAFVLRRPLRIVRNAQTHERHSPQVDVAAWRQI